MALDILVVDDERDIRELVSGVLTDEVDERDLLDVFYGVAARVISQWLSRGMREPLAARADALFELIWRAIAKPGAEAPE